MTGLPHGKRSRDKGAEGERELAAELTWLFDCNAYRGRQFRGGPDSPDVATTIEGLHIECKRSEGISLYKALEQAVRDAADGEVGVVAHRRKIGRAHV